MWSRFWVASPINKKATQNRRPEATPLGVAKHILQVETVE